MNQAILIGRCGQDGKVTVTKGGLVIGSCSIATDDSYMSNGQKMDKTTWHNVRAYAKTGQLFEKLRKGDLVYISGKVYVEPYEKDGVKKVSSGIAALQIYKMVPLYNNETAIPSNNSGNATVEEVQDDIPY
jgi:single-strand DNA-binding protein